MKLVDWLDALTHKLIHQNDPTLASLPVGMLGNFPGAIPNDWLLCNGGSFDGAAYPELQAYLGGTTLPDYRGMVMVMRDPGQTEFDTLGEAGGTKTVSTTIASGNLPVHTHAVDHDHANATTTGGTSHDHGLTNHNHGGGTGIHAHELPGRVRTSTTAHEHDNTSFQYAGRPTGAIAFTDTENPTTNSVGVGNTGQGSADNSHTHDLNLANFNGSSGNGGFANTALSTSTLQPYKVVNVAIRAK